MLSQRTEENWEDEMNTQWLGLSEMLPIVEFHDIRAENGKADKYLELIEGPLAAPFVMAGGAMMGQFRVSGHPDRLMLLRGFAGLPERRRAVETYQKSGEWRAHRGAISGLQRSNAVILTRSLAPSSATRPLRVGEGCTVIVSELRFAEQLGNFHLWLRLFLRKAGLDPIAAYATLESVNDVPAVPVVRNRTHHIAVLPEGGGLPPLPPELRDMLRFPTELLNLSPVPALVW
jgi:hypothetical protein